MALNRLLARWLGRAAVPRLTYLSAPLVVIHTEASVPVDWALAAERRCDAVLGSGACRVGTEAAPWSANVRFGGDELKEVVVGLVHRTGTISLQRGAQFSAADSMAERWGSVGLLIAALVTAHQELDEDAPTRDADTPTVPLTPVPVVAEEQGFVPRFDLLALGGPGLSSQDWRFGGELRASLSHSPVRLGPFVSASLSQARGSPELRTIAFGAGLSYALVQSEALQIEPGVGLVVEQATFSASDSLRDESKAVWTYGGDLRLDLAWGYQFQALLGLSATLLRESWRTTVADAQTGALPNPRMGLLVGLRWAPYPR